MDEAGLKNVLRDAFGQNVSMETSNGWVKIRCPLAPWTHQRGKDGNASAGVSIHSTDVSVFNCFTCHERLPIQGMLRKYSTFSGENLEDLIEELEEEAYLGPMSIPDWDEVRTQNVEEELVPLNETIFMDLYDSAAGHPYLRERGISKATAKKLELLYDPRDPVDGVPRILFPVRGIDGKLYGFSGRAVVDAQTKVRDYGGLKKRNLVLGAHLAVQDQYRKILVVEGLMDYARCHEHGYAGCAVMHSTMTAAQADIIRAINKSTYLFYDQDKAGQDGAQIAGRLLDQYVPTMLVRYPHIEIEDNSDDGYHLVKDPGELERADIEEMIEDARLF